MRSEDLRIVRDALMPPEWRAMLKDARTWACAAVAVAVGYGAMCVLCFAAYWLTYGVMPWR